MRAIPSFVSERNLSKKENCNTFGFIYPATYDVGMSGMTVSTIRNLIETQSNWSCERFFLPWNPFIEPISIDHEVKLSNIDILGFTSQIELDYLVVCWMLQKAGIPLNNKQRKKGKGTYPPLFVGGPCSSANPFPLMDLVDGYFLGDAENSLPLLIDKVHQEGIEKFWNDPNEFNEIKGFWTPHSLESQNFPYSEIVKNQDFESIVGGWYSHFDYVNLNASPYPLKQIYCTLPDYHPYSPVKGQTFQLEIGRGCSHRCHFCMIGSGMCNPARFRSFSKLLEIVEEGISQTGVSKVDIFGMCLSDFPKLTDLCWAILDKDLEISIATLRPDHVTSDLIEAISKGGQKSLTIAPESGTEKLRQVIGKPISNARILESTNLIFENGIKILKDFFLVGLPTETRDDRNAILDMLKSQNKIAKNTKIDDHLIRADINLMVPKWQTPLKNWLYYYLPKNRPKFRDELNKFFLKLNKLPHIRPKPISINQFLAQTWLTHIEFPINILLDKMQLENHTSISINGANYLHNYKDKLDMILENIWAEFKNNKWEIVHRAKATAISDKELSIKFRKIFMKSKEN